MMGCQEEYALGTDLGGYKRKTEGGGGVGLNFWFRIY